ncbi:MAG: class I SAM-dependent methyltransferase [Chloroflexota bacterium]
MCDTLVEMMGFSLCIPPLVWKPGITAQTVCQYLVRYPEMFSGATVLDMGCGCGILALQMANLGSKTVLTVDLSREAVQATQDNWLHNHFSSQAIVPIVSNGFDQIPRAYQGQLDVIVSNPPSQPAKYSEPHSPQREAAHHWNEAGVDGRAVLDSLIEQGIHWLKPQGRMIFSMSSRHGWKQTQARLDELLKAQHISAWQIVHQISLPLEGFQQNYLDFWLAQQTDDDVRVFLKEGRYYHQFMIIEVIRA